MSGVTRFEDLIAWQRAKILAKRIYACSRQPEFAKDWGLCSQIQRAATSIMANIAEGFDRNGRVEFYRFLTIARASCAEVRSHLYLVFENGYISKHEFEDLIQMTNEIGRILTALRAAQKTSPTLGTRY